MKKIEAILQPKKFDDVRSLLTEVGYGGITLSEVSGHGRQMGSTQSWLGKRYKIEVLPKIKLEIVAADGEVEKIVKAILESARTGQDGDGKVFVHRVEQAYKINSDEQGDGVVE